MILIRKDSDGVIRFINASMSGFYRVRKYSTFVFEYHRRNQRQSVILIFIFSKGSWFFFFFEVGMGQIFSVNLLWVEPLCLLSCKLTWIVYCWSWKSTHKFACNIQLASTGILKCDFWNKDVVIILNKIRLLHF